MQLWIPPYGLRLHFPPLSFILVPIFFLSLPWFWPSIGIFFPFWIYVHFAVPRQARLAISFPVSGFCPVDISPTSFEGATPAENKSFFILFLFLPVPPGRFVVRAYRLNRSKPLFLLLVLNTSLLPSAPFFFIAGFLRSRCIFLNFTSRSLDTMYFSCFDGESSLE